MTIMSEEVYLGDGLYASFDGYTFVLRAPREHGDHWVGLEPSILRAFDEFRKFASRSSPSINCVKKEL